MDSQLYATQCTFEKHDSFLVVCFVVRPYLFSLFLSRSFFVALDDFLLLLLFIRFFKYVLNSYCSHSCSTSKCVPDTLFSSSLSLLLPLSLLLLLLLTFRKSFRCTDFSRFEKKQNPKKHLLSLFSHFLFTISILHFYWATVSISPYVEQTHTLAHTHNRIFFVWHSPLHRKLHVMLMILHKFVQSIRILDIGFYLCWAALGVGVSAPVCLCVSCRYNDGSHFHLMLTQCFAIAMHSNLIAYIRKWRKCIPESLG